MKVLFVTSECYPFIKIGGLGDVAGSLPKALNKWGVEIGIALPYYKDIKVPQEDLVKIKQKVSFTFSNKEEEVIIYKTVLPGTTIPVFLFKNDDFILESPYSSSTDKEINQFFFFSRAVLKFLKLGICSCDLIHVNDWHSAMIPGLLKTEYRVHPLLKEIATVLTIHNLGPQGITDLNMLESIELNRYSLRSLDWDAQDQNIDVLLQGIINADLVNTVSPSYAKEIMTKEYGEGLDQVLKSREARVFGVLNGLNYNVYNPKTDNRIFFRYSIKNWIAGKTQNKGFLQKKLELEENLKKPIIGIISRLSSQKGIDLIIKSIDTLIEKDFQIVILGTGQKIYEKKLKHLNKLYSKNLRVIINYDMDLSKQIFAGSDLFLMPSRFEPCGLTQLIAMKYGTIPVVRATGGLKDTVENLKTGFVFEKYTKTEMVKTLIHAKKTFQNKTEWAKMIERAMNKDFSWMESAKEYLKLYQQAIRFKQESFG